MGTEPADESYKQILKSTFILGGSSVVNIFLGIVRVKVLAVLLGPRGMGLMGIYQSTINLISSVSGMGLGESGVRQVAAATQGEDLRVISRTILCLKRMALITGLGGLVLILALAKPISILTFGNSTHVRDLAILSIALLIGAVSGAQIAIIQGMRRIGDLAKNSILGGFLGTLFSIPIIYFLHERGIIYFLVIVAAMSLITSWWYSRKIHVPLPSTSWRDSFRESSQLLRLGIAFMFGSLIILGTQYLLRVIVVRNLGLEPAGIFQAAITLSSLYVGILLRSMLTDYYPRLSAVHSNEEQCSSLVNNQVEVGLLLAIPGLLATLSFAPTIIAAFYSSKFVLAGEILRWQVLGVFLQVITWPLGFILRAKGNGMLFVTTEAIANAALLIFSWFGIKFFGLLGTGIAFFIMNIIYGMLIYSVVRSKYRFTFSVLNLQLIIICAMAMVAIFSFSYILPKSHVAPSAIITIVVSFFSAKRLFDTIGLDKLLSLFGIRRLGLRDKGHK